MWLRKYYNFIGIENETYMGKLYTLPFPVEDRAPKNTHMRLKKEQQFYECDFIKFDLIIISWAFGI